MAELLELEGCPIGPQALVFVQVADIHFKSDGSAHQAVQDEVKDQLSRDVERLAGETPGVTGILVCGDIAYSGQPDEYQIAREWLSALSRAAKCPSENVWTVPGNHDVDRTGWDHNHSLQAFHKALRVNDPADLDDQIRKFTREDPQAAKTLLHPLRSYNEFAAGFGCDVAAERLHWETQLTLNDGSTLKLRGLTSILVSDETDNNGANKLIVGTLQSSITEQDGVEFMALCHHPPSWLIDEDRVENFLNARVRLQFFGHKHKQVVTQVDECVRVSSGAAFPSEREPHWLPRYNFVAVEIVGTGSDRRLHVAVLPRIWNDQQRRFVAEITSTGQRWRTMDLRVRPWSKPVPTDSPALPATPSAPSPQDRPAVAVQPATIAQRMDPLRRLTYRFLGLPFAKRFTVAEKLALVKPEDRDADETERARRFFTRAVDGGALAALWQAVESCYPDADSTNPFKDGAS